MSKITGFQCGTFTAVKNTVTGKLSFYFIELDMAESGNLFDKVGKYCGLYESEGYAGHWWVDLAEKFPQVLVVTTNPARMKIINGLVEREDRSGLKFKVYNLDDLKKELIDK